MVYTFLSNNCKHRLIMINFGYISTYNWSNYIDVCHLKLYYVLFLNIKLQIISVRLFYNVNTYSIENYEINLLISLKRYVSTKPSRRI